MLVSMFLREVRIAYQGFHLGEFRRREMFGPLGYWQ
ncbi:hypothetical protein GX48_08424 [Paracoccidioides brasiliensis]|nr:hypothetical protein GX48_08424 [Paracoccidioides brasiliensis]